MDEKENEKNGEKGWEKSEVTITPDDGVVDMTGVKHFAMDDTGRNFYGYAKRISFSTDDPKIVKPLGWIFAIIVVIILVLGVAGAVYISILMKMYR